MLERLPAKKARIVDVVNGRFFPGSKESMKPSYIITALGQKFSRANIVATVTDKFVSEDESYANISLDDGTGFIKVKAFKDTNMLKNIVVGDIVLVIGKVKEYNGEVYVNVEIVRKVGDTNYENYRRLEILKELKKQIKIVNELKDLSEEMSEEELKDYAKNKLIDDEMLRVILETKVEEVDYKPKILELIASLDVGEGVEIGKIFELSNLPEKIIERAIDELLANGDLFEPQAGVLKRV